MISVNRLLLSCRSLEGAKLAYERTCPWLLSRLMSFMGEIWASDLPHIWNTINCSILLLIQGMARSQDFPIFPFLLSVTPWFVNVYICPSLPLIMTMVKSQKNTDVTLDLDCITVHYLLEKGKKVQTRIILHKLGLILASKFVSHFMNGSRFKLGLLFPLPMSL